MADVILMRRTLTGLRAVDALGEEAIESIPLGEVVKAEITRPRNVRHHRKFFALLNVIYPHQQLYATRNSFRAAMTCALGFGETVKLPDGRTIIVPGSISFAKMDQTAFEQFYDRALTLITERILPGIDRADVTEQVNSVLAGHSERETVPA